MLEIRGGAEGKGAWVGVRRLSVQGGVGGKDGME